MEKLQEMGAKLYHRVTTTIIGIIRTLEVLLALLIIMAVILSAWDIFSAGDLSKLGQTYHFFSYTSFQEYIAFILLLVVGLELGIMLVRHTPESVVEVMLYAVARKMLIYSSEPLDMLFGVVTLAALYAIKLYMLRGSHPFQDSRQYEDNPFAPITEEEAE